MRPPGVHPGLSCILKLLVDNLTSPLLVVGRFALDQWAVAPVGYCLLITAVGEATARVGNSGAARRAEDLAAVASDHLLGPIMSSPLSDLVRLLTPRTFYERSATTRHLMCDQWNPFNHGSLSTEAMASAVELKAEIELWRQNLLAKKSARRPRPGAHMLKPLTATPSTRKVEESDAVVSVKKKPTDDKTAVKKRKKHTRERDEEGSRIGPDAVDAGEKKKIMKKKADQ